MTTAPGHVPPGPGAPAEFARPGAVRRTIGLDVVLTVVLTAVLGLPTAMLVSREIGFPYAPIALLLTVPIPLLLAFRRTAPVWSVALIYLASFAHWAACMVDILLGSWVGGSASWALSLLPVDVVVLVALYSVTAHGPRNADLLALLGGFLGAGCVGLSVRLMGTDQGTSFVMALGTAGLVLAVWAVARQRTTRGHAVTALRERNAALESERDRYAQLAVATERTRIAREMHDIVAHSLSIVIAQADGGRYAAATDPAAAERALTTIADMSRAALRDMRSILGVLRSDEGDDAAPLAPQPVHADLEELAAQVRDAGLPVSLVSIGVPRRLPPGVGLAVYRICQEALTNALKHAGPAAQAIVRLEWHSDSLDLRIDDDGRGAAASGDGRGQGLVGMRERTAMLGGTVDAGPRTGGGFRVHAVIPTPPVIPGTGEIPIVGLGVTRPTDTRPAGAWPVAGQRVDRRGSAQRTPEDRRAERPSDQRAEPRAEPPAFGVPTPRARDGVRPAARRATWAPARAGGAAGAGVPAGPPVPTGPAVPTVPPGPPVPTGPAVPAVPAVPAGPAGPAGPPVPTGPPVPAPPPGAAGPEPAPDPTPTTPPTRLKPWPYLDTRGDLR